MLKEKIERYINEHALIDRDEKILVTVSGGVDSMALMSLLFYGGYNIGVAHCNFQLRGEESDEDEVLVREEAAKYGVPFFNKRFDTAGEMEITGESVQLAARRLRYTWFHELCAEYGYDSIAIAHHADDSVETFFINLMRGTGLKGLTGIHRAAGKVIRPLLFASRREILDYAHVEGIPYREDSSNRSTKYLRNKIRLGIVPMFRDINPRFTELMGMNISRLTDAQLFIDRGIDLIREMVVSEKNGIITVDPEKIDPGMPVNFVIYELLSLGYGFKGDVVDELFESLMRNATGKKFYSKDYAAWIDRGRIVISPITHDDLCEVELRDEQSRAYCGNQMIVAVHTDIDNIESLVQPENIALLDRDKLQFPLRLRRWSEGDSLVPFGMENRKKVSDYLIDAKVSMPDKERQFVLVSGDDIVWLVGRRIDNRYKITKQTENVLKLIQEII